MGSNKQWIQSSKLKKRSSWKDIGNFRDQAVQAGGGAKSPNGETQYKSEVSRKDGRFI